MTSSWYALFWVILGRISEKITEFSYNFEEPLNKNVRVNVRKNLLGKQSMFLWRTVRIISVRISAKKTGKIPGEILGTILKKSFIQIMKKIPVKVLEELTGRSGPDSKTHGKNYAFSIFDMFWS